MKLQTDQSNRSQLVHLLAALVLAALLLVVNQGISSAQSEAADVAKDKDKSAWVAETPDELHRLYAKAMEEGNVEAVVSLVEKDALLTPRPGLPPVQGETAIRAVIQSLVTLQPRFLLIERTVVQADEIALTRGPWQVQINDANGVPQILSGTGVEIARRQPNGRWLYVMAVGGNE